MPTTQDGLNFEQEFFGSHAQKWRKAFWLDFADAVAFVERVQAQNFRWNTAHPGTELARRLFDAVHSLLPPDDQKRLRFFVAVGTPLEHHRTDAYFRIEGTARIARIDAKVGNARTLPQDLARRIMKRLSEVAPERVIIRKAHFGSDRALMRKAQKIVRRLAIVDNRLLQPVDEKRLRLLIVWHSKEQKLKALRKRTQLSYKEYLRLKFGEQPPKAPKAPLPKVPYTKPARPPKPQLSQSKGFATLGDSTKVAEQMDKLKQSLTK